MTASILIVEDQLALARTYQGFLRDDPFKVRHVASGEAALEALDDPPDALILDLRLPDLDGMEILRAVRDRHLDLSVIVITAHGTMQTAIEAMQAGAADFLVKPFTAERLRITLRNALQKQSLERTVKSYENSLDRNGFQGFIGKSLAMQAVYTSIESAAGSKASVFLTGESGTGKEVAARAIHDISGRTGAFLPLNCAAIPSELMESEVFGHVKGAFTGAQDARDGAARSADGGTLFLDEICEMEPRLQTKLLRFLQTGEVMPIGGGEPVPVDVRIVCATNRDPRREMREGRFREDLFYRLHVVPIHLPPLRERGDDIIEIARVLFARFAAEEGHRFRHLEAKAEQRLKRHVWPGNVRELQNVVLSTLVMNDEEVIEAAMLPDLGAVIEAGKATPKPVQESGLEGLASRILPLASVERAAIEEALALCDGEVRKAAVFLDIAPATIYRKRKGWEKDRNRS